MLVGVAFTSACRSLNATSSARPLTVLPPPSRTPSAPLRLPSATLIRSSCMVDMATSMMKKVSSRVMRSAKVTIHPGAPAGSSGGSGFLRSSSATG